MGFLGMSGISISTVMLNPINLSDVVVWQNWLTEAGGRGDTLRYSSQSFNNNGAHDTYRLVLNLNAV